jgi:hypothetical protein
VTIAFAMCAVRFTAPGDVVARSGSPPGTSWKRCSDRISPITDPTSACWRSVQNPGLRRAEHGDANRSRQHKQNTSVGFDGTP